MKTTFTFFFFLAMLFLAGCRPNAETLAERYMALVCTHDKIHQALDEVRTDKERIRLEAKNMQIHEQMEKLNAQILKKYQGNEQAMEVIQEVIANYKCKKD